VTICDLQISSRGVEIGSLEFTFDEHWNLVENFIRVSNNSEDYQQVLLW
jgi:hypothetical protein